MKNKEDIKQKQQGVHQLLAASCTANEILIDVFYNEWTESVG